MIAHRQHPVNAEIMEQAPGGQGPQPVGGCAAAAVRNRAAMASIILLALIALMALLAPLLSHYAYDEINYDIVACAPRLVAAGRRLQCRRHPLVRHRRGGPRPVRAGAVWRAGVAGGGAGRHLGVAADRRALWRDRRLSGRAGRRSDDAGGGYSLFPALHLLRHHPDGAVRPQFHPAVRGDRRGGMADHGADRARPDPFDQAEGIHRGGAGGRRVPLCHHHAAISFPMWWGRWWSMSP